MMKTVVWKLLVLMVCLSACKKEKEELAPENPVEQTPSEKGTLAFWISSDIGCGSIFVEVPGTIGVYISRYHSNEPDCSTSGVATLKVDPGTYTYKAACPGYSWTGTVTVAKNGCAKVLVGN
jgi:hypothetical protein